jgi:hypothetical protein
MTLRIADCGLRIAELLIDGLTIDGLTIVDCRLVPPIRSRQSTLPIDDRQSTLPIDDRQSAVPIDDRQSAVPIDKSSIGNAVRNPQSTIRNSHV